MLGHAPSTFVHADMVLVGSAQAGHTHQFSERSDPAIGQLIHFISVETCVFSCRANAYSAVLQITVDFPVCVTSAGYTISYQSQFLLQPTSCHIGVHSEQEWPTVYTATSTFLYVAHTDTQ